MCDPFGWHLFAVIGQCQKNTCEFVLPLAFKDYIFGLFSLFVMIVEGIIYLISVFNDTFNDE